jgi:hypothetical protein
MLILLLILEIKFLAMKKKLQLFTFSLICICFFTSCNVSKHYVNQISNIGHKLETKTKTVVVSSSDNVRLNNFKKTFNKNYPNKEIFAKSFAEEFSAMAKNNAIFSKVELDRLDIWNSAKESSNADFIIHFSDFEITNRIESRHSAPAAGNNFGSMQTTSVEYCVIHVKVVIYDVKNKKEVLDFISTGESSIFFFDFKKSFEKAKARSITHIINYLKSGKTLYKKY